MIDRCSDFDLGLDRVRIKDGDAARQHATVDSILARMFAPRTEDRAELQMLADEVGLGKTYIALGVAYSVLAHMRSGAAEPDLDGCYQKVLVITPQNQALFGKWNREVAEFVRRCVPEPLAGEARAWFAPAPVERLDDLAVELRRPGKGRRVIVTHMGVFGGGKLTNYGLKRRFLLGCLFRHWGTRFRLDARERLLRGAPDDWPRDPTSLTLLTPEQHEILSFDEDEVMRALSLVSQKGDDLDRLLAICIEVAEPFTRAREERFIDINKGLTALYRRVATILIGKDLPLVIVDEAHNWKNGPSANANGYDTFKSSIAGRTRRALLLTATPFQLRPDEMLELLRISDDIAPCPTISATSVRRHALKQHRENTIRPALKGSTGASQRFSKAWARLPPAISMADLQAAWDTPGLVKTRAALRKLALGPGAASERAAGPIVVEATTPFDPSIRALLREALLVYTFNADLSAELGALVIRHRRKTQHRAFRVGREYGAASPVVRLDNHVLHAAPGLDVLGEGELPHYILMRCVSEMNQGRGRSSLGANLTGCYSTLLDSSEGKLIREGLSRSVTGKVYFDLLGDLVTEKQDPKHPKLREVVESVLQTWRAGEKTLIFCFRINTAERLRDIIDERIRREMAVRRKRCLGGEEALRALRGRLTGRDRDLVGLGLDRVLWSYRWAWASDAPFDRADLELVDEDIAELARASSRHAIDLDVERLDRVFLNRAIEQAIAKRVLFRSTPPPRWERLLRRVADSSWVEHAYGLGTANDSEDGGEERADFDERGANSSYEVRREALSSTEVEAVASRLRERWRRGRLSGEGTGVLDNYARGASLWFGANPLDSAARGDATVQAVHEHLAAMAPSEGTFDWEERRLVFQGLRRALLRESVLLRLLPEKTELEERRWGELLADRFLAPLPGQKESMGDRVAVFLEDLRAASGSVTTVDSARHAIFDSTRLRDQQVVALVSGSRGSKDQATRQRVFSGFNSPLLPEVLVCTSVGQEGIDLHRHCRHVVHYDLAWNPAVLEQRTGRADRIGSKTFRERTAATTSDGPFLEIGVPFLAGTYDERMYEELRLRAQTFEVLTGGDVAADGDNREGQDDVRRPEGHSQGLALVPLPDGMLRDLRVALHVWTDPAG
jgi:hypothetical protein